MNRRLRKKIEQRTLDIDEMLKPAYVALKAISITYKQLKPLSFTDCLKLSKISKNKK